MALTAINLEACIDSPATAHIAEQQGAHQLELCDRLDIGGTTPSRRVIESVLATVDIPVKVILRPRGGDFSYTQVEINQMISQLRQWHDLPIAGVVLGCLTPTASIDVVTLMALLQHTLPAWSVTFHKAIDATPDPVAALRELQAIPGITHVLSSGGAPTATAGVDILRQLLALSSEGAIELIAAGSITYQNLPELHRVLQATTYHGRRIVPGLLSNRASPCNGQE